MFDLVHKHRRLMQILLALLIIPPFAFWGIDSYQRMGDAGGNVAMVGDIRISEQEFSTQLRQQQDRVRQLLGRAIDPATLDSPESRARLLDSMIAQRLLTLHVVQSRMAVTDDSLRELIMSQPAFHENGRFSSARYQEALKAEGYTAATFESSLRRDLLVQQFSSAVSDANIVSRAVSREWALLAGEQREVSQALIPVSSFASQIKSTPEAIQAFYDQNRKQFEVPEQVRVEYVVLSNEALAASDPVKPEEVKAAYESQRAQFEVPEERQASHILLAVKQGAGDEEKKKARARAEELAAQLKKNPAAFAELAKKTSDDPGSAGKGGDLGFTSRGMFVKPVEDAIFSMKQGEITRRWSRTSAITSSGSRTCGRRVPGRSRTCVRKSRRR
jgi:peptidyl-prolyl cis-trans isomerase D